jgi:flavorubredoxin
MKKFDWIYRAGSHRWGVISRDPERAGHLIDTNEYLVAQGEHGMLLDPGGSEIFPAVFSALAKEFDPTHVEYIFASHQDPDIASSLGLWLEVKHDLKCLVSWLWGGFIPHYGIAADVFLTIPDEGMEFDLGGLKLQLLPAHYLHSSGNFNVYDPKAKILFSGDIGAALLPPESNGLYVKDFDAHIRHSEMFHLRWMGSNEAKLRWCERVSKLDIDMMCPQHGAIYRGADVGRFIDWFASLRVGTAP